LPGRLWLRFVAAQALVTRKWFGLIAEKPH